MSLPCLDNPPMVCHGVLLGPLAEDHCPLVNIGLPNKVAEHCCLSYIQQARFCSNDECHLGL